MKKNPSFMKSRFGSMLLTISLSIIMLPAFSELPKGTDRLKPVLKNYKQQKIFLNWEDQQGEKAVVNVKLAADEILVVYALINQSSGFQWGAEGYDNNVLEIPNILLTDACEPCSAPGASVYQRIVAVPKGKGSTQIKLAYYRPWKKEQSRIGEKVINIETKGALKSKFAYIPSSSSAKKVAKIDYEVKALPAYFDWRDQDIVTPVKDQGSCGSCWAFGATAGFEAKIKKKDGVERDLSEQFLVSCNEWGMTCAGGWWAHDLWWNEIAPGDKGAGAVYEEDFPYQNFDAECDPPHTHHEQLEGWAYTDDVEDNRWPTILHDPTPAMVKEKLYEWGPIPTGLCTDDWNTYTGGILSGSTCTINTHIVLITGWDDNNQCFIVKNSWGQDWGDEGYIRIAYGSHLIGQYSTYIKYDKTNPRIVLQGEQFYEGLANDGSIRLPIQINLFDAGNFTVTVGEMTEGTHFNVSNLPSGLTVNLEAIDGTHAKITLEGIATSHIDANDAQVTLTFTNAAFAGHTASEVETSTMILDIDFFDPYTIVYEDIEDLTVNSSTTWMPFNLQNGQAYGLWYSYYEFANQAGTMTYFLETYTKKVICTTSGTDQLDRMIRRMEYGDLIDGLVDYMVTGGSYGDQHKITTAAYTAWNGYTAYVGIQFNQYGGTCYGWMRLQVNSSGSEVTLLDYAYNEEPYAPIMAGYTSEVTVQPVADFSSEVDESYTGIDNQYYDESSRKPSSWAWSFPGGTPSTSSERNPKVSYNNPGTYNATLTVTNSAGNDTKTINNVITIFNAAPPVADFEIAATVVPQGATMKFYDQSTNRPTTWLWNFNGGDPVTSTDPDAKSTFASIGTFNINLEVENPFGSDNLTKSIQVVNPPSGDYCSAPTTDYETIYINNVKLANLDHSSGNTEGGYENHTSQFAAVDKNSQYTVTVGFNNDWQYNALGIWIDWNQDGDWTDANETIYTMNSTQVYEKTFTVPSFAISGMTVMRIRLHYSMNPFACGENIDMGEAEDYTIIVNGGTSTDTEPPSTPGNLTIGGVTQNSIALSWNASTDNVGVIGYNVYTNGSLAAFASSTSYTVKGLSLNTSYSVTVRARDAADNLSENSNAVSATTIEPSCDYCSLTGNDQAYDWITGVEVGTYNNSSGKENGGYSDFTSEIINLSAGSNVDVVLTPNNNQYNEIFVVWIDYNGDCDFDDSGEEVLSGGTKGNTTGTISIPSSASGTTRMRIAMRYSSAPSSSCGSYDYGETEDYTVIFSGGGSDTQAPTAPSNLTSTGTTQTSVSLSWNASSDNVGVTAYDVYSGSTIAKTVTSTSATIDGLTANTSYSFSVRARDAAGNVSVASNTYGVTTDASSDTESPTAPSNLSESDVTQTSITISWSASSDNIGVELYEIYNGGNLLGTTTETSYTITGLTEATSYTFTVYAKDAAGNTSGPGSISVTTLSSSCSYCSLTGNDLTYEWITGVEVGTYNNSSAKENGGYSDFTSEIISLSAGSNVDVVLTPNNNQYTENFVVWIDYNGDCDFDDSGEEVLSGGAQGNTTGTISIPSSASGTTRMRIAMRYGSAPSSSCGSYDYGETEDYTVSFSGGGSDTQAPTAPSNLTSTGTTQTTVSLSWNASSDNVGVTAYDVYSGSTFAKTVTSTSATIDGLTANTTYSFSVRAKDAAENVSAASNTYSVTTDASSDIESPTAPSNLSESDVTQTSITISWSASSDNIGVELYEIYNGSNLLGTTTETSYTITGLTEATSYTFTVYAKDAAGNTSGPGSISVTTLSSSCSYCTASGDIQSYEWIAGVAIGSYSNTSGASAYTDNTDTPINLTPGSTVSLNLTPDFQSGSYPEYFVVWIDFNGDCDFDDSGEEVFSGSGSSTVSGSFTVPLSAVGQTIMRIAMRYNSAPSSCGSIDYGEVEDYAVSFGVSAPLSVSKDAFDMAVYPNPNKGTFNVKLVSDRIGVIVLNLYDTNGQLILNQKENKNSEELELIVNQDLVPGVYTLQIISGNESVSEQIVVE